MTNEHTYNVSRRNFLAGAAATAGLAALGLTGCGQAEAKPSYLPETWDGEADVVVIGTGGAGLAATIEARNKGLEVITLEASPEDVCGGNTRVSGNYVFIPDTPEQGTEYQLALNGPYDVDPTLIEACMTAMSENKSWLEDLDIELKEMPFANPEFPGLPGSEGVKTYAVDGTAGKASLWNPLFELAQESGATMLFDTRATRLIYNPENREVCGVKAGEKNYKARKGVIMACGGFENNPAMIQDYYPTEGAAKVLFEGTPYNRGDGILMAQDIGAQLWHMNAFAGTSSPRTFCENTESVNGVGTKFATKDWIYVGPDAKRFMYEESTKLARHGRVKEKGAWPMQVFPNPTYVIAGANAMSGECVLSAAAGHTFLGLHELFKITDNAQAEEAGIIQSADTIEALAEKIGLNATTLAETLNTYNAAVAAGKDEEFHRGEEVISNFAFDFTQSGDNNTSVGEGTVAVEAFPLEPIEGPFYAIEMRPGILNSQGGPKRNEYNQVLDFENNPIPRLYAAGELGTIFAYMYNGGGNVSEAVASGRVAARHCADLEPWETAE